MANKKVNQLTSKPAVNLTDLFLIADPTSGQAYKTTISDLGTAIGSGVSSVNSLVGAVVLDTDDIQELVSPTNKWFTDTRARAALSASSPLTYNSGTGVFGIQVANGSQNGYLSSADWTTFNAKQAALSGTGFVKSTGGTISYDTNTYLTTSSAASTYLALAGGTMTGALFGASASFSGYVGFNGNTSPLYPVDVAGSGRFSGDLRIESTNPRIYLTDTDNNPDYFISNTDGTFTVYDVTNSASRLTIGTGGAATFLNSVTASALYVSGMTAGNGAIYHTASRLTFANYNASGTLHFEVNGGTGALTINADTSASFVAGASFGGTLSGTSATFSGNVKSGNGAGGNAGGFTINYSADTASRTWRLINDQSLYGDFAIQQSTTQTGTTYSNKLYFNASGAATFSSTISTPSFISSDTEFRLGAAFSRVATLDAGSGFGGGYNLNWNNASPVHNSTGALSGYGYTSGGSVNFYTNSSAAANTAVSPRMTITTSGNVGIGNTTANSRLYVEGSVATNGISIKSGGNGGTYPFRVTWNGGTEGDMLCVDDNGRLGIGTTSPYALLSVYGGSAGDRILIDSNTNSGSNGAIAWGAGGVPNISARIKGTDDGGYGTHLIFETRGNGASGTTTTERMRITSGGNVLIGTTTDYGSRLVSYGVDASSSNYSFRTINSNGIGTFAVRNDGAITIPYYVAYGQGGRNMYMGQADQITGGYTANDLMIYNSVNNSGRTFVMNLSGGTQLGAYINNGSTSWTGTSDERVKDITCDIENALEKLSTLRTVEFTWKFDPRKNKNLGVIAQDVEKVLPQIVDILDDDINTKGVRYTELIPVLIQAIKEQQIQIEQLKNK